LEAACEDGETPLHKAAEGARRGAVHPQMEKIFVELMTSDRKLKASREGSK